MTRMTHDDHDLGLAHDVSVLLRLSRRPVLSLLAGAGIAQLIACASSGGSDDGAAGAGNVDDGSAGSGATDGSCTTIPEETAGPYPGDGSNGPNVLAMSGIVRSDITQSIGSMSGVAEGVPLTVTLRVLDGQNGCTPLGGYAVYLWHATLDGKYTLYTLTTENYLRGVQETNDAGEVTFTTIFPGCYDGRMPHIHFEVYPTLDLATDSGNKVATSQLAFPSAPCDDVYATSGYEASVQNFAKISFDSDNVFRDGVTEQLATVTGSVADGYVATLDVTI